MVVIRILLFPMAFLYGLVMQIRNFLYDWGIFKTHQFNKPIISIGNLTAGGTGKTPFTIYLAEKFIDKNKKVAIVSRGYGRKSKGFHLLTDGNKTFATVDIYGDEPILIAQRLPGVIVAVSEKRKNAISYILENYNVDIVLLDDGFQHRAIARDLDIVLLKDEKKFKNRLMLPSGLLREFKFNIKRAGVLVSADKPIKVNEKKKYFSENKIDDLLGIDFKTKGSIKEMVGQKCVVFAGIALPDNFVFSLKEENIIPKHFVPFKDHYNYSEEDLTFLISLCKKKDCNYLLCTEKDLVKISEISLVSKILIENNIQLLATRLNVKVKNENDFFKILKYLS